MGVVTGWCGLDDVRTIIADAVVDHPVVMVVAPAGAIERCIAGIDAGLADALVVRASRIDVGSSGALARRIAERSTACGRRASVAVIAELQWADAASLCALSEQAAAIVDGHPGTAVADRMILVRRVGGERPDVAALELLARRSGCVLAIRADDVESVIARGVDRERAVELVAATGGAADLIGVLDDVGSLVDEVAARLAVVHPEARSCAELIAFGADPAAVDTLARMLGADDAVDAAFAALTVEGLLVDLTMPPAVVNAVRATCTAGRRARVVAQLLDHGPAGISNDLAVVLAGLGDHSAVAAELYTEHAGRLASADPIGGARFVAAARRCGADPPSLAIVAAMIELASGDPVGALRTLHDTRGREAEFCRAVAWSALGDLAAAAGAFARSSTPALAVWASIGAGARVPAAGAITASDADEPADVLVRAVSAWANPDATVPPSDLIDDLRRAVIAFRVEPSAARWPVTADEVGTLLACRLGEVGVAEGMIAAAIAERPGGHRHHARHRLLAAWLEARRGLLDAASSTIDACADEALAPGDRLLLDALRCSVAVRDTESADVGDIASAAATAVASIALSVYDVELVAEVSAALHRARRVPDRDPLEAHEVIAERLGTPRLRRDVEWARLRATMAGDDLRRVSAAARPLAGAADAWPPARDTAALLDADVPVDAHRVSDVAARLAASGLPHEAARLCGLLATTTSDEQVARSLLRESRAWRAARARVKRSAGVDHAVVRLSEQEERVARMVLDGHTHKQIGAVLFVSPKTVEHHVAHIRTKLSCTNRAEMMAALRDYLAAV